MSHVWIILAEPGQSEHQRRVLFVWRDREKDAVAISHSSAELRVTHELPDLLRSSQVLRQEMLRPCHLPLQWRQAVRKWQACCISCNGHAVYAFARGALVQMFVQVLRSLYMCCGRRLSGTASLA